jgi:hypothetical protein
MVLRDTGHHVERLCISKRLMLDFEVIRRHKPSVVLLVLERPQTTLSSYKVKQCNP